jgi:osmotically-inducible protein OsmY
MSVDDAVGVICHTAAMKPFQTTPESKAAMEDLVLSAEVKTALMGMNHGMKISAQDGVVFISSKATTQQQPPLIHDIEEIAKEVPGVKNVRIDVEPIVPFSE